MLGRVFVSRRIPSAGLELLAAGGAEVAVGVEAEDAIVPREQLLEGARAADVLLCLLTETVDDAVLAANPDLRGVSQMAVGYNNIDVAAATARGIPVCNTPGVLTDATADLTWALILATARRVVEAHAYMTAGRYKTWGPNLLLGTELSGRTLGIVGYGRIGRAVRRRALGFEMEVLVHSRSRVDDEDVRAVGLDELLARADVVSLHVPLTDATRGMIDAAALAAMKPTAILINTSRGPVVDEPALVEALARRDIAGAGLDVYAEEPAMAPGLAALDNAVLLPHIGSATRATRDRMARMAAEAALAHLRGERAPHCVNPEVYDGAEVSR